MDSYTVGETVGLYEVNYRRLTRLFPRLRELEGACVVLCDEAHRIRLQVVERTPYTVLVDLSHDFDDVPEWLDCPAMRLRVYHDAKVVEVVSYQGHFRFRNRYEYPNAKMCSRHEKRLVNLFLGEWLEHSLSAWQGESEPLPITSI